jgi:hypothetical protein
MINKTEPLLISGMIAGLTHSIHIRGDIAGFHAVPGAYKIFGNLMYKQHSPSLQDPIGFAENFLVFRYLTISYTARRKFSPSIASA